MLTVALVVLVIFLFLRNISATIIPSLALPASIVGTFAAMYLLGYSLDNLSLMALTLSVGFVVDDAIVMLENIVRHMEHGEDAMTAALEGSKEIAFTIVSMTLSLAAVFIPVLFMGGIVGRLLHEFAVTIGVAILVSGFVSLSLTPMLSARFLQPPHDAAARPALHGHRADLRRRAARLRLDAAQGDDAPRRDDGRLGAARWSRRSTASGSSRRASSPARTSGSSAARPRWRRASASSRWSRTSRQVVDIVRADPNVKSVTSIDRRRRRRRRHVNGGRISDRAEAARGADADGRPDHRGAAAEAGARCPASACSCRIRPSSTSAAAQARAQYQFTLQSGDTDELYERRAEARGSACARLPGLIDVSSDLQLTNPQVNVTLDRDRIAALGLTADQVESALTSAFGSRQVAQIYAPNNAYQVIMRVAPEYQRDAVGARRCSTCKHADGQAGAALERHDASTPASARCRSTTPASCRR